MKAQFKLSRNGHVYGHLCDGDLESDRRGLANLAEGFCPDHGEEGKLVRDGEWGRCPKSDVWFRLVSSD